MSVLTFFGRFLETITGDGHRPDRRAAARDVPMLSDHLGYRAYDRERKIYHLTDSRGFILELSPMVGADDKIGDILTSIFADQLEPGCEFQVINYASPRIAEKLQSWAFKRTLKGGVFDRLARNRLDLLRSGAWNTLASDGPFCLRNFRILLSVGVRANSSFPSMISIVCVMASSPHSIPSMSRRRTSSQPTLSVSSTISCAPPLAPATMSPPIRRWTRSTSSVSGAIWCIT
jgi:hypothetical protein